MPGQAAAAERTPSAQPPPPLRSWSLGVPGCSPRPAGPGPTPSTKMESSPPAKSTSWPAAAGLPELAWVSTPEENAPLGSSGLPGREGAVLGGGTGRDIPKSSSLRSKPLFCCVTWTYTLISLILGFHNHQMGIEQAVEEGGCCQELPGEPSVEVGRSGTNSQANTEGSQALGPGFQLPLPGPTPALALTLASLSRNHVPRSAPVLHQA